MVKRIRELICEELKKVFYSTCEYKTAESCTDIKGIITHIAFQTAQGRVFTLFFNDFGAVLFLGTWNDLPVAFKLAKPLFSFSIYENYFYENLGLGILKQI